jgi:hypothetical protein
MPRVSTFYGIAIYMYYNDHAPPHFHAIYGESEAVFAIGNLQILDGDVPRRVRALVVEWGTLHNDELIEDWNLARRGMPLNPIRPLD